MKKHKESPAIPVIKTASNDATELPKAIEAVIESPCLRYALDYAQILGWSVFPCHSIIDSKCTCGNADCKSPGKHPLTQNGVKDATTNPQQIIDWWTQYPHANIAVATGKVSGIVVIDIDINHAQNKFGDVSLAEIEAKHKSKLCGDIQALTGGGGFHYVFAYPQGVTIKSKAGNVAANIDTRADNGYIIVEPSNHISGNSYQWEGSSDPFDAIPLPEMPQWLIDEVKESDRPILIPVDDGTFYSGSEWDCMADTQKADLLDALNHCTNELRDDWLHIGMAIHSMDSGEHGFNLWTDWSKSSSKYDAQDTARVWTSFNNSKDVKLNKETIFYDAKTKYNWIPKPPQISIDYPSTPDDSTATAREFLKSIGLNPDEIEFSQAKAFNSKTKKTFDTVTLTQDGVTFQHLIDCTGDYREQTRHSGKYTGKVYSTPSVGVSEIETIYIAKCPIDALSLAQSGFQSVAVYGGSNVPVDYYKSSDAQFIVAFNDIKSAYQTIKYFKSLQGEEAGSLPPDVIVVLPPEGKTWNDLLQAGELTPETMEVCKWRGKLAMAYRAADYFAVYREQHREKRHLVFGFNGWTYLGYLKTERKAGVEVDVEYASRLADCTIRILYSIEDDTLPYDSKMSHIIELYSTREKTNRVAFKASELSNPSSFREKFANYRQISDCDAQRELKALVEHLYSSKPPKVRKLQMFGYDRKSNNYVYPTFLYDKDGNRHAINADGYFAQGLMPYLDKTIKSPNSITEVAPEFVIKFIDDLYTVYGDKALLSFGFYIAATFSHTVFDKYDLFPFLSLFGAPQMGKSTLTRMLCSVFFIYWDGIAMGKGSTKKADLRKIGVKSGVVTPLNECTGADNTNFSLDTILTAYNRLAIGSRAAFTNDNQTIDIELHGALSFVQNNEPFTTRQQKERVISLNFPVVSFDETRETFKRLESLTNAELSSVGDYIIRNRKHFESNIVESIEKLTAKFIAADINDRIAKNHAIALSGINLLMELLGVQIYPTLMPYTTGVAETKCFSAATELDIAEHFFTMLDTIVGEFDGVARRGNLLYANMPKVQQYMKEQFNDNIDKNRLFAELRRHDRWVAANKTVKIANINTKCWVFKMPDL